LARIQKDLPPAWAVSICTARVTDAALGQTAKEETMIQPELLRLKEAAQLLGYKDPKQIQILRQQGLLRYYYTPLSKRPRVRRQDVLGLISIKPPKEAIWGKRRGENIS